MDTCAGVGCDTLRVQLAHFSAALRAINLLQEQGFECGCIPREGWQEGWSPSNVMP